MSNYKQYNIQIERRQRGPVISVKNEKIELPEGFQSLIGKKIHETELVEETIISQEEITDFHEPQIEVMNDKTNANPFVRVKMETINHKDHYRLVESYKVSIIETNLIYKNLIRASIEIKRGNKEEAAKLIDKAIEDLNQAESMMVDTIRVKNI